MKYFLLAGAIGFIMSCCGNKGMSASPGNNTDAQKDTVPPCVRKMLNAAKTDPLELPLQVDQYVYDGKTAYLFTADCCDRYNVLYDEDCKMICAPSGGFTGKGDGKCAEFDKTAKLVKRVWRKPGK